MHTRRRSRLGHDVRESSMRAARPGTGGRRLAYPEGARVGRLHRRETFPALR